jgi:hypothetical protein
MKPDADQVLNMSAMQLLTQVLPQLPPGYAQGTASLLAVLSMMAAQEYERGADIRATENADMRAVFCDLASSIEDAELNRNLKNGGDTNDASLTISALNIANCELRRLLIELQTHVETLPGAAARQAERRIWALLKASAERRLVRLPAS